MTVLKFAAHVVPVAVSTTFVVIFGALIPTPAAWVLLLLGPAIAIGLLLGYWERPVCQVFQAARPLTPTEVQFLAPALTLLTRQGFSCPPFDVVAHSGTSTSVHAVGVGRRTVIVSAGLLNAARGQRLPAEEIAGVIAHAAGLTRARRVRSDLVLTYWTLPWRVAGLVVAAAGRLLWPLRPIFWGGWVIMRPIVGVGAAVQTTQQGYPGIGAAVLGLLLVTYAHPWAERAWARHLEDVGDRQVADHGLAVPLAMFLRRFPPTPRLDERTHFLDLAPSGSAPIPAATGRLA